MPYGQRMFYSPCNVCFRSFIDSTKSWPKAILAAIAEENVQPVPCVFLVSILSDVIS